MGYENHLVIRQTEHLASIVCASVLLIDVTLVVLWLCSQHGAVLKAFFSGRVELRRLLTSEILDRQKAFHSNSLLSWNQTEKANSNSVENRNLVVSFIQ